MAQHAPGTPATAATGTKPITRSSLTPDFLRAPRFSAMSYAVTQRNKCLGAYRPKPVGQS